MSSYGSAHSGNIHPSHYQQYPQQYPQPPYPTTPGPPGPLRSQAFYPPNPQQQQYGTSPTTQYQQPFYSSSPGQQLAMPTGPPSTNPDHRSSSFSQHQRPPFAQLASAPIAIPQSQHQALYDQTPAYARRPSHHSDHSHHSHHAHDAHASADGEEGHGHAGKQWGLDDETLRAYEKRYAKDRELEKRPTFGGSLMSAMRVLGRKRD
ncbi:hypothetical protein EK21DRAFT_64329 [Setomelanomma holmii]|uniref:Uncharacterized protein n=1 Tax=Setomelanomma holmii TaxID=210430 RepID=A0A9P4HB21_9PLEO|nr:hypothetical protein EK21DRAFT_64329 [Setomelanomma holmii]